MTFTRLWKKVAVPVLFLSCAGADQKVDPVDADLVMLESRQAQGYHEQSIAIGEGLIQRVGDTNPDVRCRALLAMARARAGKGLSSSALETFAQVRDGCRDRPIVSAKGLYQLGMFLVETSDDWTDALPVFRLVIRRFPDEPAAKRAAMWMRDVFLENDDEQRLVDEFGELYRQAPVSAVGPFLVFEAALRVKDIGGDGPQRALSLFDMIIRRHETSGLADDAMYESARICLDLGMDWDAVDLLKSILRRRVSSLIFGSYDTSIYPKAAFLLAEAVFAATHNPDSAIGQYRRFISAYPNSSKRDDAWFRIYEIMEEHGRDEDAREVLELLTQEFPLSGKGRAAKRILKRGEE